MNTIITCVCGYETDLRITRRCTKCGRALNPIAPSQSSITTSADFNQPNDNQVTSVSAHDGRLIATMTVRELKRMLIDARRYQWLRADNAYAPEEEHVRGGDELDRLCDEGMLRHF